MDKSKALMSVVQSAEYIASTATRVVIDKDGVDRAAEKVSWVGLFQVFIIQPLCWRESGIPIVWWVLW